MLDRSGKRALHAADGADTAPRHDVVISYFRKDALFAAALEPYTPPKGIPVAHCRLNAFRDADDFTGTGCLEKVSRFQAGSR